MKKVSVTIELEVDDALMSNEPGMSVEQVIIGQAALWTENLVVGLSGKSPVSTAVRIHVRDA